MKYFKFLLIVFVGLLFMECFIWTRRSLAKGTLVDGQDTIVWDFSFNDYGSTFLQVRSNLQIVDNSVDEENLSSNCIRVYRDSLLVKIFSENNTLLDSSALSLVWEGKYLYDNEQGYHFNIPVPVSLKDYKLFKKSNVKIVIYPCGFLKYKNQSLLTDTIVIQNRKS